MRPGREQDHCVWPDFISVNVPVKNDIIPFFFLISTCDCSLPPVPRLIIIKLFAPSHSPFLIFTGIVIFLWTSCRNVSLGQEQRLSFGGSTLPEFALGYRRQSPSLMAVRVGWVLVRWEQRGARWRGHSLMGAISCPTGVVVTTCCLLVVKSCLTLRWVFFKHKFIDMEGILSKQIHLTTHMVMCARLYTCMN